MTIYMKCFYSEKFPACDRKHNGNVISYDKIDNALKKLPNEDFINNITKDTASFQQHLSPEGALTTAIIGHERGVLGLEIASHSETDLEDLIIWLGLPC